MSRCTEYVPTVVEIRDGRTDDGPRHIVASAGPAGVWTLCSQYIPIRRLRILKRSRLDVAVKAGRMLVRNEEQHIEGWEPNECHRACADRHLLEKRRYRIGSGDWRWLWRPEQQGAAAEIESKPPATLDEARARLAALGVQVQRAERHPWWRRWLGRKEKAA